MNPALHLPATGEPAGALPRVLYWKRDLCAVLGVKLRTLERMLSAGEIPPADVRLRGRPAWRAATLAAWEAAGCPKADARNPV